MSWLNSKISSEAIEAAKKAISSDDSLVGMYKKSSQVDGEARDFLQKRIKQQHQVHKENQLGYDSVKSKDDPFLYEIMHDKDGFLKKFTATGAVIDPIQSLQVLVNKYRDLRDDAQGSVVDMIQVGPKNPATTKAMKQVLSVGADPLNFVSGPVGAGLSAIDLLTPEELK